MKKIFILLLTACCLLPTISIAQWTLQNSGTTSDLYDVFCVNADTVYVVGANGTILKTTDGGDNWLTQNSVVTNTLKSVYFIGDIGYIAGDSGTILKTVDGGLNWNQQNSQTSVLLTSVFCINKDTVYIAGYNDTILKTVNGGTNWIAKNAGFSEDYNSIFFLNYDTGYAVGSNATILKTIDNGNSWTLHYTGTGVTLYDIFFINYSIGYSVSAYGNILKTTNGGDNWFIDPYFSFSYDCYSIYCHSLDTFFIVGWNNIFGDTSGIILKTTDSGYNWVEYSQPEGYYSVNFANKNIGYVVGSNGIIRKTTTAGTDTSTNINILYKNIISIYPNPSNNHINLKINAPENKKINIEIINSIGQLKYKKQIINNNKDQLIDTSKFLIGIYFLKIQYDEQVIVKKFIIQ
ncbi:MAG: T9SS type A sorting domain-containing protein [Bacteroidia bacterium]|nr:T9SS type A sorting domain-containing protein [Bacteroidia bacterium]